MIEFGGSEKLSQLCHMTFFVNSDKNDIKQPLMYTEYSENPIFYF